MGLRISKENLYILAIFAVSASYFIIQHQCSIFWDFAAYSCNARHLLGQTAYFEWMRPPLYPLFLAPFMLLWDAGEYLSIIFSLCLFFYSAKRLALALRINPLLFLVFMMQPIFFIYGASEGTELLSASLFMLFLEFLIRKMPLSGFFLGLGMVTRYNFIYFLPLVFWLKKPKRILVSFLLAALPMSAWLLANLYYTGNLFTGLADNIALNIIFQESAKEVQWAVLAGLFSFHFLLAAGGAAAGLGLFLKALFSDAASLALAGTHEKAKFMFRRLLGSRLILVLIGALLIALPYFTTPQRVVRYLFLMIIPLSYFIIMFMRQFRGGLVRKTVVIFVLILSALSLLSVFPICSYSNKEELQHGIRVLSSLGLDEGQVLSNLWVHLDYLGIDSMPYPGIENLESYVGDGHKVALFRNFHFGDTGFFMNESRIAEYPLIYNDSILVVIGNNSRQASPLRMDMTYLELRALDYRLRTGKELDIEPCLYVFPAVWLERPCIRANAFLRKNLGLIK